MSSAVVPSLFSSTTHRAAHAAHWSALAWSVALIALAGYAHVAHIDTALADLLYSWQGRSWPLRDDAVFVGVLHDGGRRLAAIAWLAVVLAWGATWLRPAWRTRRRALARLAVSVLVSVTLVSALKQATAVHCPWDLVRYGGTAFAGDGGGACFPAGHASVGYAWLALAFAPVARGWRRAGLATGLLAGLVFGIAQQLRGAHFVSHDLWAAALCWAVAVTVAVLWPTAQERAA